MFRGLPPQVRIVGRVATSYPDYLLQLSLLLRDPIYRGSAVQHGTGQPILLIPGVLAGDWRTCVDPQGDNYQVSGRHLGLVVNREVYRILADILGTLDPGA